MDFINFIAIAILMIIAGCRLIPAILASGAFFVSLPVGILMAIISFGYSALANEMDAADRAEKRINKILSGS